MASMHTEKLYASSFENADLIKMNQSLSKGIEHLEKQNKDLQAQLDVSPIKKEFERYKQDCRKRALEMAHHELCLWFEKRAVGAAILNEKPNVDELSNKYYNWLISIPNE